MPLRGSRGKRALITGGAGFIGSHLAESLIADGYAVTALDDLSTGSEENIAHLDKLELVVGDTADERLSKSSWPTRTSSSTSLRRWA